MRPQLVTLPETIGAPERPQEHQRDHMQTHRATEKPDFHRNC